MGESNSINCIYAMYFSPTGTTRTICTATAGTLAELFGVEKRIYDFTLVKMRGSSPAFARNDMVVFGVPTYAGRVPNVLLKYLDTLDGNGAFAVPVVTFGNRNYDDSLIELRDILGSHGFKSIAAGAFVGEHSFSRKLAAGRPNAEDINCARLFGERIYKKFVNGGINGVLSVKGEDPVRPYYQPRDRAGVPINILKVKPAVRKELCGNCGICSAVCPMGSIPNEDVMSYTGICIKCGACEKKCPRGARYYDDAGYIYHRTELEEGYPVPKENEIFI